MGMDNDFYSIRKNNYKKNKELGFEIFDFTVGNKMELTHIIDFRKNYILHDTIKEVLQKDWIEIEIVDKKQLKKIIDELRKESYYDDKIRGKFEGGYLLGTIKVLETIVKLFDFKKNYLVYHCIW